jgi:predicted AAA+ superfamily ATPase
MYKRTLNLNQVIETKSLFLLGPRQTGKSTLIHSEVPAALFIDLLEADTFRTLLNRPELIREYIGAQKSKVITIDEIQKLPSLLDEVHRLIERDKTLRFILTGSSAKKLRRAGVNLLGGRARRLELHPITFSEFATETNTTVRESLLTLIQWGGLPSILTSKTPKEDLKDYVGTYLIEEIQAESHVRSLENFSKFLDASALVNTEQLNYSSLASDVGLPSKTVQEYFQLLDDTLIGKLLLPYRKTKNRKAMTSPKFYLFDVGVANAILGRWSLDQKTPEFGKAFEHLLWRELSSYISYMDSDIDIFYWRSSNKFEVDFILQREGEKEPFCAIEVKAKSSINTKDFHGLLAFSEEFKNTRKIVISLETQLRKTTEGIEIWPAEQFLTELWKRSLF